jgi:hypothetical protein
MSVRVDLRWFWLRERGDSRSTPKKGVGWIHANRRATEHQFACGNRARCPRPRLKLGRMSVEIRLAVASDAGAIGQLFARAFANDPVTSWVTPSRARRERLLQRLNTVIARYEGIPRGATYVARDNDTVIGAAIWQPPGPHPISWRTIPFALLAGRALGRDMTR